MEDIGVIKQMLKTQYSHIYSVSDNSGTEYLFRSLSLKEVKLVEYFITKNLKTSVELEDFCLENCLLYPEVNLDRIQPGVVKQIADEILVVSGVTNAEYIAHSMRSTRDRLAGDIILDIKSYIISAIPRYTDEELDKFSLLELIEKLVLSEKILKLQAALAGFESNIQLNFEIEGEEEVEYETVQQPKAKAKPTKNQATKEELLKRIIRENLEHQPVVYEEDIEEMVDVFEGFDVDLLQKMQGQFDPNDPIARKLHGLS